MDKVSPLLIRQQCMVDGRWTGEPETAVTNPATGEAIARVPNFGAAETKAAIEAAHRAFPAGAGGWPRSAPRSSGAGSICNSSMRKSWRGS